jgi:hypothetical protein
MSITYLAGGNQSGTSATRTVTYTATLGAFAVACWYTRTANSIASITDTLGDVWQQFSFNSGAQGYSIWFTTHIASGSVTITATLNASNSNAMTIASYSASNPRLTKISSATGTGTSPSGGTVTTNFQQDDIIIAHMGINTNTPIITNPGGYTQRQSTGNVKSRLCDIDISTVGGFSPAYSLDVSETWGAVTLALQEMDDIYMGLT